MKIQIDGNMLIVNGLPVFFICDRDRCDKCSFPFCGYTTDIYHARWTGEKTLRNVKGGYWEDAELRQISDN